MTFPRLTRLYNLPVTLPDILNKPTSRHVSTRRTGTRRCMSGSKLWLEECLPYLHDATTNRTGIELESSV